MLKNNDGTVIEYFIYLDNLFSGSGLSSKNTALLPMDFVKPVLFANLLVWSLAYYLMNRWLQNLAYSAPIGIEVFFLAGLAALGVAALTVSFQSVKAARTNPVEP